MKKKVRRRRCKNCHDLYKPDHRNIGRQKFCDKPECKIASKKHSQQKWLMQPKNRDHFSGPENVIRVQQWREQNPGYWKLYRKRNPEYCERNRKLQRVRDMRRQLKIISEINVSDLAKKDASDIKTIETTGG